MADQEVVGKVGHVLIRIRGAGKPGEITVPVRGGTETFIAFCDQEIERGAEVLVVAARGNRTVDVERWS